MSLILYFCSMDVNDALVLKLATLARLSFKENEMDAIKTDLQKMIAFVQQMDEVNTDEVEPLLHMSSQQNQFREDVVDGSCSKERALQSAGKHNSNFFMVPTVIQK